MIIKTTVLICQECGHREAFLQFGLSTDEDLGSGWVTTDDGETWTCPECQPKDRG